MKLAIVVLDSLNSVDALFVDQNDHATISRYLDHSTQQEIRDHEALILISLSSFNSHESRGLLAHEVFHAYHSHVNPGVASWIWEGLATLFEFTLSGHVPHSLVSAFSLESQPLTSSQNHLMHSLSLYAHQFIFFSYLSQQCFQSSFPWALVRGPLSSWDQVLSNRCQNRESLKQLIENFFIAQQVNKVLLSDGGLDGRFMLKAPLFRHRELTSAPSVLKQKIIDLKVFTPVFSNYRALRENFDTIKSQNDIVMIPYRVQCSRIEYLHQKSFPEHPTTWSYLIYKTASLY